MALAAICPRCLSPECCLPLSCIARTEAAVLPKHQDKAGKLQVLGNNIGTARNSTVPQPKLEELAVLPVHVMELC